MNEKKFDNKGKMYSKARPAYPQALFEYVYSNGLIDESKTVADIGSGTGIFTLQIAHHASKVYAVEPNSDMRIMAENLFREFPKIISVNGTAEKSMLPDNSVDVITVAQAFHWFDRVNFKKECQRILKPGGKIILIWNDRDTSNVIVRDNFAVNKKFCENFKGSSNGIDFSRDGFTDFFDGEFDIIEFDNGMIYNMTAFIGRNLSSSYAPTDADAQYSDYIKSLEEVFDKYQIDGVITYPYITRCYIGEVNILG